MIKKLAGTCMMLGGLAGFAGPADAHYVYTLSGWLYHSVGCSVTVKNLPNQTQNPGAVACSVTPISARVWCENPQGHFQSGQAAIGTTTVIVDPAPFGPLNKKNGTATATVETFVLDHDQLQAYVDACPNPNWGVVAVVIERFDSTIEIFDSNDVLATRVKGIGCHLPANVIGTFPIAPNTPYECPVVNVEHVN